MKKRFILMFLFLTLISSSLLCNSASAKELSSSKNSYNGFYTEEEVFAAWGGFTKSEQSDYSGMYIDDNNNLTLLFVDNSSTLANAQKTAKNSSSCLVSNDGTKKQSLIIKPAKYNYATLLDIQQLLIDKAYDNKAVKNIGLDVKNNRIEVGFVSDSTTQKDIIDYLYSIVSSHCKSKVDRDIISVHEETTDNEYNLLVNVNETSTIYSETNGDIYAASVGVGYYRGSTGQYGLITTGHAFSTNQIIYYNGTKIGKVTKNVFNGTCDAAFVLLDAEDDYESNANLYEELSSDVPIIGATVIQRGGQSGYVSAKVLDNNFSYTGNGYHWTNLIKTDGVMTNGDSGGGMQYGTMDAGRTAKIVGFLHAGAPTSSLYIKGGTVANALNN